MGSFSRNFPRLNATANTIYRALNLYLSNRSLRAWYRFLIFLCSSWLKKNIPPFITIAPTYRCPCRCEHCGINASEIDHSYYEMDTDQIKSVIGQSKQLGVLQVTFTGGEPLLREDIVELVQYSHKAGLLTRINTSGVLLDRSLVSKLKKAGLTQCAVSIDDADAETHDQLRGVEGAFQKALEGIKTLKKFGILCQINTYTSKRNVTSGLERIIQLGRKLGVLAVYFIFPTAIGRWEGNFDVALNQKEKAMVRSLQETTFVHLELATIHTLCGIFKKMILFVSPEGNVTPCPFVSYSMGNIKDFRLKNFWEHFCDETNLSLRGECPMNIIEYREALKRHVKSVAERLNHSSTQQRRN